MKQKTNTSHWGKKLLFTLLAGCALQSNAFSQSCTATTEDFTVTAPATTPPGWTLSAPAGDLTFTGGTANFNNVQDGCPPEYAYKQLSASLSNTSWVCDFKFTITGGTDPSHTLIAFSEDNLNAMATRSTCMGTVTYSDMDVIGVNIQGNNSGPWFVEGYAKDRVGGSVTYVTAANAPTYHDSPNIGVSSTSGTTYYGRLQRLSATKCLLSIFSDSNYSTHITGSPVCWTIPSGVSGLGYMQLGSQPQGGNVRFFSGDVDNVNVSDNIPYISGQSVVCSSSSSQTYTLNSCLNSTYFTAWPGTPTYSWTLPAGSSGTSTTNSINATIGSSGTVSCTVSYGTCANATYTYSVTYGPNPTADAGADVSYGDCYNPAPQQLGSTSQSNTTYSWVGLNGAPTSYLSSTSISDPTFAWPGGTPTGNPYCYEVTATSTISGCTSTDQVCVTILGCRTIDPSLNDPKTAMLESATVYPNPSTGEFMVNLGGTFETEHTVTVKDVLGRTVYTSQNTLKDGSITLRLNDQPDGMYFLYVEYEGNSMVRKLLKE